MGKIDPVEPGDAATPPPPPPPRGGGGFTFILALGALGVSLYLFYSLEGFKKIADGIPRAKSLVEAYESDGEADQTLIDNMGALEERVAKLEEAGSRMEGIIEQIGQEVGSSQGISEQGSSIPLYLLRISLADIRLRMSGDPQSVLDELKATMPFVPDEEGILLSALQADIDRLEETLSKDELVLELDKLAESLLSPLLSAGPDDLQEKEGVLGALFNLVDAKRTDPREQTYLNDAREAAREARTLALVGDRENYLRLLKAVESNIGRFREQYDPEAIGQAEASLSVLLGAGLPEYNLSAARPILAAR